MITKFKIETQAISPETIAKAYDLFKEDLGLVTDLTSVHLTCDSRFHSATTMVLGEFFGREFRINLYSNEISTVAPGLKRQYYNKTAYEIKTRAEGFLAVLAHEMMHAKQYEDDPSKHYLDPFKVPDMELEAERYETRGLELWHNYNGDTYAARKFGAIRYGKGLFFGR